MMRRTGATETVMRRMRMRRQMRMMMRMMRWKSAGKSADSDRRSGAGTAAGTAGAAAHSAMMRGDSGGGEVGVNAVRIGHGKKGVLSVGRMRMNE